jgi:tetratricopeptide (TPR) repeat protein
MAQTANEGDLHAFDSLMARAIALTEAKEFREAADLLEQAVQISPSPSTWQLLGIVWRECGETNKARAALLQVVELKRDNPRAWVNLAAVELSLGLINEAVIHYQRAVDLAPKEAKFHIWLANAHDRAGNLPEALKWYAEAEALQPENAEVFYERALALRNHKKFDDAAINFRRAYELDPAREGALQLARDMAVAPYLNPAEADAEEEPQDEETGKPDASSSAAVSELSQAAEFVASDPKNAVYWNNLGYLRWQDGDLEAALQDLENAVRLQPDYLQARVNQSAVLKQLGRLQEAERAQRQVIEIDPYYGDGFYNLAKTLLDLRQFEKALTVIDRGLALESEDADYYVLRGTLLETLDRKPDALSEFTRALAVDPKNAKAYFQRGNMQFDLGRLQTAVADYTRALELTPHVFAEVYLNRGLCHFALKQNSEAISDLEKALQLKPDQGIAHLRLGEIALRENRQGDAETHLAKARTLGFTVDQWG